MDRDFGVRREAERVLLAAGLLGMQGQQQSADAAAAAAAAAAVKESGRERRGDISYDDVREGSGGQTIGRLQKCIFYKKT